MTTPPQPPKLTISRAPAPAVLSWNHNPPPRPRYTYVRIIADCVDCGESIEPGRVQLGKVRCFHCQSDREKRAKR